MRSAAVTAGAAALRLRKKHVDRERGNLETVTGVAVEESVD